MRPVYALTGRDALDWIHTAVLRLTANTRIEILNVFAMSGKRPDGHPSAQLHRELNGYQIHDCRHWCLPGVPDAWNLVVSNYLCQHKF
jgi:hypothetical protein